jgi:hypothetical protein
VLALNKGYSSFAATTLIAMLLVRAAIDVRAFIGKKKS